MHKLTNTLKLHNGKFTLIGYSRAGDATGLFVPELGFLLDGGVALEQRPSKVFVTHSHSDHSFQLPYMYSRGSLLDIYVPEEASRLLHAYLKSAQNLNDGVENGSPEKFVIKPVAAGHVLELGPLYKAYVLECCHTVPTVGYAFYEKRSKLKPEYAALSGKEVGELRKKGTVVTESIEVPLFSFLGDTTPEVFSKNPTLLGSMPYVIVECTFLDGDQCNSKGHTFWAGLKPHVVEHPETIFVLIHFSSSLKQSDIVEFFKKENLPNVVPFV